MTLENLITHEFKLAEINPFTPFLIGEVMLDVEITGIQTAMASKRDKL